jgi:signal transduction histidine kinase
MASGRDWLLQTLSDVFTRYETAENEELEKDSYSRWRNAEHKAMAEWQGAIVALESLLQTLDLENGLLLSGPSAVIDTSLFASEVQTRIFSVEAFKFSALLPCRRSDMIEDYYNTPVMLNSIDRLPLLPNDPIAKERFCLVFTSQFALAILLGQNSQGMPAFYFSFDPESIADLWQTLRSRLVISNYPQLQELDTDIQRFAPQEPSYRLVTQFSRQLLKSLPNLTATEKKQASISKTHYTTETIEVDTSPTQTSPNVRLVCDDRTIVDHEMELLQAFTHEIRTPLTTIRTMTRLLLKKRDRDFTPDVIKKLETIDRECSEQIDRMELIFRAVEWESKTNPQKSVELVPISLDRLFQESIPRWQKQAQRRNLNLDVILPQKLPHVVSDATMLERMLTGLMENFTKNLPAGGEIKVEVSTAGDRLKLQFFPEYPCHNNPFKSLGQLLMFQPETGNLSLNLDVTKNLFNALGGKFIVKQRPQNEEVVTIFLPLNEPQSYKISEI